MKPTDDQMPRIDEADRLRDAGDLTAALALLDDITRAQPELATAHFKRGTVLARLDRNDEAEDAYRKALELEPGYPQAANNLGFMLAALGKWNEAEALYREALAVDLDFFQAHFNLADVLIKRFRLQEALYHARRALAIDSGSALAVERVAATLNKLGRSHDAIVFMDEMKGRGIEPTAGFWATYGWACQTLGRLDAAEEATLAAVALNGNDPPLRMNRLYFSNFLALSREESWRMHREFGEWARATLGPVITRFDDRDFNPERRINVGIVSGDLRRHSVAYFVPGAFEHLDPSRFKLHAYSASHYSDNDTLRLKPMFKVWRSVASLDAEALYRQILDDRIDILIDLSGHTSETRLMVFAKRAAPVQITYLGYPNTTGIDVMDYRITDTVVDPEGEADRFHSEKLWRLDRCFLCYEPLASAPPVAEVAPNADVIVFGSFNARPKYSDACVEVWLRLLREVPNSRLLAKSLVGNGDPAGRAELMARFTAAGIDPQRIELFDRVAGTENHLGVYGKMDIALDTFPYNGTTTTCEALWMGVPVVTLRGDRHASRVGASLLESVGLPELVAGSIDEYVAIARELAADRLRLQSLRHSLRDRLRASPLLDKGNMACSIDEALRRMWSRYCAGQDRQGAAATHTPSRSVPQLIRLNVGGNVAREGWKILDAEKRPEVDFVKDIRDLGEFEDESCAEIYVSHVLEHVAQGEVLPVLGELHRLLIPEGRLYLAVPDTEVLATLMIDPALDPAEKFEVMRLMYGEQATPSDFHSVGFTFDFLVNSLAAVEFSSVEHVESFGLFDDDSERHFAGRRVSLNVIATK